MALQVMPSRPYSRGRVLKANFCEARSSVLRAPSSQIGWDDDAVDALGVNGSGSVGIIARLLMVQTVAA
jgi:hypothetical protein